MALCNIPAKRRFQTYLASLVNKSQLSEAYKGRSTLTDTRMAFPCAIFTIHHAFYPCMWAYVGHVILDTRLPLFSRVR